MQTRPGPALSMGHPVTEPVPDHGRSETGGAKPVRSCVVCGRRRPKGELLRVCRRKDGTVFLDPAGRSPGRGVYVCPRDVCADNPRLRASLSRGLRVEVPQSVVSCLRGLAT